MWFDIFTFLVIILLIVDHNNKQIFCIFTNDVMRLLKRCIKISISRYLLINNQVQFTRITKY